MLSTAFGITDKRFGEFIVTMGLRSHQGDGVDKLAYAALFKQAVARGWVQQ